MFEHVFCVRFWTVSLVSGWIWRALNCFQNNCLYLERTYVYMKLFCLPKYDQYKNLLLPYYDLNEKYSNKRKSILPIILDKILIIETNYAVNLILNSKSWKLYKISSLIVGKVWKILIYKILVCKHFHIFSYRQSIGKYLRLQNRWKCWIWVRGQRQIVLLSYAFLVIW